MHSLNIGNAVLKKKGDLAAAFSIYEKRKFLFNHQLVNSTLILLIYNIEEIQT